jgi:DNA-binding LytR/AlgR family response regulator
MFKIAVVEDDPVQTKIFSDYFRCFIEDGSAPFSTHYFADGEEIIEKMPSDYDIIFLDIKMKRMDGMTAARKIREFDKNVIIIFITNMSQYAIKGYSVGAFNFLLKPVSYFAFSEELRRSFERLEHKKSVYITVRVPTGLLRLDAAGILYVEVIKHKVIIHTENSTVEEYIAMKEIEAKLASGSFARCNNCYLVNLAQVKGIVDGFCLVGGEQLQISRSRKKSFMDALTAYLGDM